MAFKGEPRLVFMQIGLLGILDESELIKRELPAKKGFKKFWELWSETQKDCLYSYNLVKRLEKIGRIHKASLGWKEIDSKLNPATILWIGAGQYL